MLVTSEVSRSFFHREKSVPLDNVDVCDYSSCRAVGRRERKDDSVNYSGRFYAPDPDSARTG